jgi:hypothetical protein
MFKILTSGNVNLKYFRGCIFEGKARDVAIRIIGYSRGGIRCLVRGIKSEPSQTKKQGVTALVPKSFALVILRVAGFSKLKNPWIKEPSLLKSRIA